MNIQNRTRIAAAVAALAFAGLVHADQSQANPTNQAQSDSMATQNQDDSRSNDSRSKTATYVDDAAITAKVKSKFVEDRQVRATAISVDTRDGVVDLTGNARSEAEKMRAEQLARDTKGTRDVNNRIVVR